MVSPLPGFLQLRGTERLKSPFADQPQSPDTSVSFSEIFRLVQAGQDIPGLQKLNITPTNGSPTPSQMARRPKPWENNEIATCKIPTIRMGAKRQWFWGVYETRVWACKQSCASLPVWLQPPSVMVRGQILSLLLKHVFPQVWDLSLWEK
uniref:Peroxisomal membrane protein PEX14-like KPWE domain-containing protein n=1 Tax=Podarcis muralis TaxID=64176 RepID=A0A670KD07_PODMU